MLKVSVVSKFTCPTLSFLILILLVVLTNTVVFHSPPSPVALHFIFIIITAITQRILPCRFSLCHDALEISFLRI